MEMGGPLCCFCAKEIKPEAPEPLWLTVGTSDDNSQTWFCHAACFKERLNDPADAKGLFDPVHF